MVVELSLGQMERNSKGSTETVSGLVMVLVFGLTDRNTVVGGRTTTVMERAYRLIKVE